MTGVLIRLFTQLGRTRPERLVTGGRRAYSLRMYSRPAMES